MSKKTPNSRNCNSNSKNENQPTTSTFTDNFQRDWEDDEFDLVLTQMALDVDVIQHKSNGPPQQQHTPKVHAREKARPPKRDFSPSFVRPLLNNQQNGGATMDLVIMSQNDHSLLSQDAILKYKVDLEKVKQDLMLKEGESKILRDKNNEFKKQIFSLQTELNSSEQKLSKQKDELALLHQQEIQKLKTTKEFLERENRELERSLTLEKAARQKAEFLNRQKVGKMPMKTEPMDVSVIDQSQQPKTRPATRSGTASSQFPDVKTFYSPNSLKINQSEHNATGKKRKAPPSDDQCPPVNNVEKMARLDCMDGQNSNMAATFARSDDWTQTDDENLVSRECDLTEFMEEAYDSHWYLKEVLKARKKINL